MEKTARLIIPVWGEYYVDEFLSIALPAVLAPGNLPALRGMFDVQLIIVTETRLFDMVRGSRAFQAAERICNVRLIPLDDLLTSIFTDYGMVLTYAFFRGFADLGPRATETYLLPFVADFVISDGSLRHLGGLMQQGKRVIHAPSFRVIAENVGPQLRGLVASDTCALSVPSRQLAKLALANKHPTVQARTINQRLCHLDWMDQLYWFVNDDTLIGYQSPMALVAVKPERFVGQPLTFWDYGFLPEAAPTADPHFIGDSDDFFMLELQSRDTGHEMIRIGWTSLDELARTESVRTTKEHRRSSKELIKIHAADLPAGIDRVIEQSRTFMAELYRRMSPSAAAHIGHPLLGRWFEEASLRQRGAQGGGPAQSTAKTPYHPDATETAAASRGLFVSLTKALQKFYSMVFGIPPKVGKYHPLWSDICPITDKVSLWQQHGQSNVLRLNSSELRQLGNRRDTIDHAAETPNRYSGHAIYDVCVCEIGPREVWDLNQYYTALRPLIKDGGHVLFCMSKKGNVFDGAELSLSSCDFAAIDVSQINFHGTLVTALLAALYVRAMRPVATRPIARTLLLCALILMAPIVRMANTWTARRDPSIFSATWTSITIELTVKRRSGRLADAANKTTKIQ